MPLILFILSALVLGLEVLETKIFSHSLENSLIFLVVGVVLLGFGAGGSILSLRKELPTVRPLVRNCLWTTAGLLVLAHVLFAQFSDELTFGFDWWTAGILSALAAPYVSAGMAISAMLADEGANVHRRYGINLAGSAVGCLLPFAILGPLSGPECLVVCAFVCALLAASLMQQKALGLAVALALGIPAFLYADQLLPYQIQNAKVGGQLALIEENLAKAVRDNPKVESGRMVEVFDRWDPTARVRVHKIEVETEDPEIARSIQLSRWFTQDSSYGSPLLGRGLEPDAPNVEGVYERSCYGVGYFRELEGPKVLIIGLGGAPDVQTALHHEASEIDCVDINATTVEMVRVDQAEYLGDPYGDPRVSIHLSDGRSYVRSTDERYDLIQLSGVDTKSVLASGTLALNESYLYTENAFDEYVSRLDDDGILVINYAGAEFRRRLTLTAAEAVARAGATDPLQHLMILQQSEIFSLIVKRTPFTEAEVAAMKAWLARVQAESQPLENRVVVWAYELLTPGITGLSLFVPPEALFLPGQPLLESGERLGLDDPDRRIADAGRILPAGVDGPARFLDEPEPDLPPDRVNRRFRTDRELLWAIDQDAQAGRFPETDPEYLGRVDRFLDRQPVQLAPVPDSRPFFFNITKNQDALARLADSLGLLGEPLERQVKAQTVHFGRAFSLLIVMTVLAFVLILGPLPVLGMRGLKATETLPFAFYFSALGAGFIFAMSGLIQRYVLFLGHQAFAFSVVIGGLLVSAGIGSTLAGAQRFASRPRRTVVVSVLTIWVMLAAIHLGLDGLFSATAGFSRPTRVVLAVVVLVPLGIPLGAMFPTGLAVVKQRSPLFVPWAFGINGVFSVIGSSIVLPGALILGFPSMAVLAALVYGFAMLIGLTVMKPARAVA